MAKAKTTRGTKVRLLMGDGEGAETFSALCGLTAREINFQKNTNDFFVPDCDNPDDPAWRELAVSGKQATVTGTGLLDQDALAEYQAAYDDDDPRNFRVEIAVPLASNGGYWQGAWVLTRFRVAGNDGALTTVDITLESSGGVPWVPALA